MTKTIKSQTSNTHYFLTIDEQSHAVDYTCGDYIHRHHTCKHMSAFNAEVTKAATFQALRNRFDSRLNGNEQSKRCYCEMSLGY